MNSEQNFLKPENKFVVFLKASNNYSYSSTLVPAITAAYGRKLQYRFLVNFDCVFTCSFKKPGYEITSTGALKTASITHSSCGDQNQNNWYEASSTTISDVAVTLIPDTSTSLQRDFTILFEFIEV